MEFQWSCFKSWKMMLWKCCTQYASKCGKLSSGHRTGKGQFSFQSQERQCQRMLKQLHNCTHLPLLVKQCLKFSKPSFSNTWIMNLQIFKMVLEKAEELEIKLSTSAGSSEKQEFQRNIYFCFTDYAKPLTVWITINCGKFWERWEYQTTCLASWEICMQLRKQQIELDLDQQTWSK